jgi:hypothetical protein
MPTTITVRHNGSLKIPAEVAAPWSALLDTRAS